MRSVCVRKGGGSARQLSEASSTKVGGPLRARWPGATHLDDARFLKDELAWGGGGFEEDGEGEEGEQPLPAGCR
jgi:hypothetical protein